MWGRGGGEEWRWKREMKDGIEVKKGGISDWVEKWSCE